MKHLLQRHYRSLLTSFARGRVLLAFDFDGTLAPLVNDPDVAVMRARTADLFDAIAHRYPCIVVSGRAERDVRARLGDAPVVAIVGNHGAEDASNHQRVQRVISDARRTLTPLVAALPGVWLENKKYSLSIHYRHVAGVLPPLDSVRHAITAMTGVGIVPGKSVINVVAAGAPDKGTAVERLRRSLGCTRVLFVGDDETDEHVFRHLPASRLIGVRIGDSATSRAHYMLRSQAEIDELLDRLIELRPASERDAGPRGSLGHALEFMRLLWSLDHALHKRSKHMARKTGITGEQRLAMRLALHAPDLTAGELATLVHVHPSTLTGMLRRMETQGLLKASPDPRDRRRLRLKVTSAGRRAVERAGPTIESAVDAALATCSARELEAARRVLERVIEQLQLRPGAPSAS